MPVRNFWILSFVTLFSCGQSKQDQPLSDTPEDPKDNLNIQVSSFSEIDSSGIIMFPLSMGESKRSGGSLSYKEIPNYSHWNIIFFNSKNGEYHLLSDKKMLIKGYEFKYSSNDGISVSQSYHHIFYTIISFDYNKDKILDDTDPDYLFISDKEGNKFRQISPNSYTVMSWQFIKSSNKVLMLLKKDSDANNSFDENDEIMTFEIEVDKDSVPKQVFSDEFKTKLKALYDRDWKRLKK